MEKPLHIARRKASLFIVFLMVAMLGGCLKESAETIVLPPYVESVPDHIIPEYIIDSLKGYMAINDGPDPPVIEGSFLASPMTLVYASDDYANNNFYDARLMFSSQSCRNMVCYFEEQYTAQLVCDAAIVTGRDGRFTFAGRAEMVNTAAGWSCTIGLVISGEMYADGSIGRLEYANAMLEKNDPFDVLLDVGDFRVYRDNDATTVVFDWQPNVPPAAPITINIMKQEGAQ